MVMDKKDLIKLITTKECNETLTTEVVDAFFTLLNEKITLNNSLHIEDIGLIGAHERKGANKEKANEDGIYLQKNLSIFFHPDKNIKKHVRDLVEDE